MSLPKTKGAACCRPALTVRVWDVHETATEFVDQGRQVLRDRDGYRMSFSVGGLLLNESVEVARLHAPSRAWDETLALALSGGVTSLPKTASRRRTLREIGNRLSQLSEEERSFLTGAADRREQAALLWVASCRAYRFVREFAVEVLCDRHLSNRLDLPLEAFDHLLEAKGATDPRLAEISPSTLRKLRQVLFRMMREAGVLSATGQIQAADVSPRLVALLQRTAPADLAVFPGCDLERV